MGPPALWNQRTKPAAQALERRAKAIAAPLYTRTIGGAATVPAKL